MRCLKPRTVGFQTDGKTIAWSEKTYSKEFPTFKLPCGKCIPCRLEYARDTAVRCVHEAKMYSQNSFVTLTYDDKHLESDKLIYSHFQTFMKDLRTKRFESLLNTTFEGLSRESQRQKWKELPKDTQRRLYNTINVPVLVTGEYGDRRKRPHWHALLFNYAPTDLVYKYSNDRSDKVYSSKTLDTLWGRGITEVGSVTFQSASYCARYAAKKLVHGYDQDHEFHPIHKRSSKYGIGKKFLETYWKDVFNNGFCLITSGNQTLKTPIPRYYERWLAKHQPDSWLRYVTRIKETRISEAEKKAKLEHDEYGREWDLRLSQGESSAPMTRSQINKIIIDDRFKRLQQYLKGDI